MPSLLEVRYQLSSIDGARAGSGIVLGAILGLVLWLFIILATISLVWAL